MCEQLVRANIDGIRALGVCVGAPKRLSLEHCPQRSTSDIPLTHRGHLCRMSVNLNMTVQKRLLSEAYGDQAVGVADQSDPGKPGAVVTGKQGFIPAEDGAVVEDQRRGGWPHVQPCSGYQEVGTPEPSSCTKECFRFPQLWPLPRQLLKSWKPASWKSPASRPAGISRQTRRRGPGAVALEIDRGLPSQCHLK